MISVETFGDSRQLLSLQFSEYVSQRASTNKLTEFPVALGQQIANFEQFIALRHIHTGKNQKFFRSEVKIETRPGGFAKRLQIERRGDVGLVRTLVLRKTCIAINAEDRFLNRRDVSRSKLRQRRIDGVDQRFQRSADVLFVDVLAWLEPFALVIALETAEEGDCFFRKTWKAAFGSRLSAFGQNALCCCCHKSNLTQSGQSIPRRNKNGNADWPNAECRKPTAAFSTSAFSDQRGRPTPECLLRDYALS